MSALAILPLGLGLRAQEPPSDAAKEVRLVVEKTANGMIDVLKDKTSGRAERQRKLFAVIDPATDFALMGKLALGPVHWQKFDEAQRKEFTEAFSRSVRNSCFEKVEIYTNETVDFDPPAPAEKGKYRMLIRIHSRGQVYKVLFKLYQNKSPWRIYDLEVEGVSVIRTYAAQYEQVLAKGTPQDLLAKMRMHDFAAPDELERASHKDGKEPAAPPKEEKGR
ncbi:MAG: hypothetical protein A2X36_16170 [Elusimicrobia bacterium GWA2_69_24]|nr:MAG: hypothetical protein A2X36_16170 [Elusimicrobia bacterium GWA2_69_24]